MYLINIRFYAKYIICGHVKQQCPSLTLWILLFLLAVNVIPNFEKLKHVFLTGRINECFTQPGAPSAAQVTSL